MPHLRAGEDRGHDGRLEHATHPARVPGPLRRGLPGQDGHRLRRAPPHLPRSSPPRPPGWRTRCAGSGVEPGDRVAYLLPNIPEMLVAHFAVPLAGAVLVAINTRLSTEEIRYILDHSGCRLLVVDAALYPMVAPVAGELKTVEEIITVIDPANPGDGTGSGVTYDDLLARGTRRRRCPWTVDDEDGHDLDQLHVRDDGAAQGRDVPPPRRAPELVRRDRALRATPRTASTCGRCRCSTATAGARRGRSRRSAAPTSACARSAAT